MDLLLEGIYDELSKREKHESHNPEPHAYASEAYTCARKVALRLLQPDDAPGEEYALTSLIAFRIGNIVHEVVQSALQSKFHADIECPWSTDGLSGRADGLYESRVYGRVCVEIKSVSSWAFARAMKFDCPSPEHIMQASLSAKYLGADSIEIIYVNKLPKHGEMPVLHWISPIDQGLTELEVDRLQWIVSKARDGVVPERFYDGEVIEDPSTKKWPCAYCPFFDTCMELGPGEVTLSAPGELPAGIQ